MNINENIIEIAETIADGIKEHGAAVQIYGSWNKGFTEEHRKQLVEQLREKGIETIKLYDYAELYIVADLDSEKKNRSLQFTRKVHRKLSKKQLQSTTSVHVNLWQ